ncbi:MAG: PstS family phosphate ABC transporter substrate-binding protein [Synechococcales cyanobacterium C42_A2020_086]|jgi:phosphate transport system substrate-binding protein|nr:PstS family phosphate ABC transporter substrate-binding protein [Synechococcales cyanobacterium M58_A2018_015]MBF2074683.1 PstS family phosphate ABC transporter substrate-binding protein [Synechococcales cyanobacterium C42_A2020_086]
MVANGVKVNRSTVIGAIGAVAAAAVGLSATVVLSQSPREIQIDGSSTVFPITEAVAEEFQNQSGGAARVTVGISGTGGGFKRFCNNETDISNASRPIKQEEIDACRQAGVEFIELPIAYDALSVVVNPQNDWVDSLTVEELKKIWEPDAQGRITNWNQVRSGFPDAPLVLFGPGTDSGTFDYFTEAIVGDSGASRADYTASEDDNVLVQGVTRDRNALGYFGFAYYEQNRQRLKSVPIDNGDGPVPPTRETVENGTYQPLSRPLFIYVNAESAQDPLVKQFVEFYLSRPDLVDEVGYVRLPQEAYEVALQNFNNNKLGSVFAGRETIGVRIPDLLRLEGVQ